MYGYVNSSTNNTEQVYQMRNNKSNSFNHQVFQKSYQRLKLSPSQRIVFQRLLGFLLRNEKPFPYSAVKMAEITGLCLRTIFNILNDLENLRLITRIGLGKNRRFIRGSILNKICSTVQNRLKIMLLKNSSTVQLTTQNSINRAMGAYKKTSNSLKRKKGELSQADLQQVNFYLKNPLIKISKEDLWLSEVIEKIVNN